MPTERRQMRITNGDSILNGAGPTHHFAQRDGADAVAA
jgi:hypothetical protein